MNKLFSFIILFFISTNYLNAQTDETQTSQIIYSLPSPLEYASVLSKLSTNIATDSLLPLKANEKELAVQQKALLLGGYYYDAGLFLVLQKPADFKKRIPFIKSLFEQLAIPFPGEFENRVNRNINKADSLSEIFAELEFETDEYLTDNNRKDLAQLISIGGILEGIYISARSFSPGEKNETEMMGDFGIVMKNVEEISRQKNFYQPAFLLVKKIKNNLPSKDNDDAFVSKHHSVLIDASGEIRKMMLEK
jgi:hypothetical protein